MFSLLLEFSDGLSAFLIGFDFLSHPVVCLVQFSSVQSLSHIWLFVTPWTAARQAPCPLPTPGVYSNSCPSCQWCHPTVSSISSSAIPCSFLLSFPVAGSFQMSQFFTSGSQRIGVSALASVWFPLGWTLLSVQGTLKSLLQHHSFKSINSLVLFSL